MGSLAPASEDIEATKQLVSEFWASMDATSDIAGESLFVDSGVLFIDAGIPATIEVKGRAELAEFCRQRSEKTHAEKRVTRHLISNLRPVEVSATAITLTGYVTDYVGAGDLPLPLLATAAVADFDYELVRDDAGLWRFLYIRGKIIFAGPK